jgi:hypothetical protein
MRGWKKMLIMVAVLLASGCTSTTEKIAEARARRKATAMAEPLMYEGFMIDIRDFRHAALEYLSQNDSLMDRFKCRLEAEHKEDNPYYRRLITKLETRNREMKKKVDEYRVSHPGEWEKFKAEFSVELAELGQSYRSLKVRNTHPEIECK